MRLVLDISTLESSKAIDDLLLQLKTETEKVVYDAIRRYEKLLKDDTGDDYRVADADSIVTGVVNTLTCSIRGFVNTPTEWNIDATASSEIINSLIDAIVCSGERVNDISEEVFIAINDINVAQEDIVDTVPIGDFLDTEVSDAIENIYRRYSKRIGHVCCKEIEMLMANLMSAANKK